MVQRWNASEESAPSLIGRHIAHGKLTSQARQEQATSEPCVPVERYRGQNVYSEPPLQVVNCNESRHGHQDATDSVCRSEAEDNINDEPQVRYCIGCNPPTLGSRVKPNAKRDDHHAQYDENRHKPVERIIEGGSDMGRNYDCRRCYAQSVTFWFSYRSRQDPLKQTCPHF